MLTVAIVPGFTILPAQAAEDITTDRITQVELNAPDDSLTITEGGSVTTTGTGVHAINSTGATTTITNRGTITTTGSKSDGLYSTGSNAKFTNNGIIKTIGSGSDGINSYDRAHEKNKSTQSAVNAVITNSGIITTTGDEADGIRITGANAIIHNSGIISTTGTGATYAISGGINNSTLNLYAGSQIFGRIDLGGSTDSDTVNIYSGRGLGVSAAISFENTETLNILGNVVGSKFDTKTGKGFIGVDPTAEATRSVILSGLTSAIHQVVSQRMAQTANSSLLQRDKPITWIQAFGGTFERDSKSNVLAYDSDQIGFTLGHERQIHGGTLGFIGGYAYSDTDSADIKSFKTEVYNYFIGAYGGFSFVDALGDANLTGSALAGYSKHENQRLVADNINRHDIATADIDSFFVSPSLTLSAAFSVADKIEIRPFAAINYSVAWMDGYTEQGTTRADLKVDDRTLQTVSGRLQLASACLIDEGSEIELRAGVNSRHSFDDDTNFSIKGNRFSYGADGNDNTAGFVGANFRVSTTNQLEIIADIEYAESDNETRLGGTVGLNYCF
ncbi:MAG: hypothetical protein A6F71_02435 [Cycloclasticus sp. symbiont of Poecilosclerida sp. M]|nr:MAG: hypothetical protein A6F71_02435 [Cycloclasticus sp. symbiont of Poecilosclerida sp. M]